MAKKSKWLIAGAVLFSLTVFTTESISGSPLVIKGVDGTWLPVVALSWSEQNNGVVVKPSDGTDPLVIRKNLIEKFPDMTIEIINRTLFFPSTNTDDLFEKLNGIDVGITVKAEIYPKESIDKPVKKTVDDLSTVKDELIGAVIENVFFDPSSGKLFLDVSITKRSKKGDFSKLYGKHKLEVSFKMTNGVADPDDEKNKYLGKLLFSKKGTELFFIPEKNGENRNLSIFRYSIKK